MLYGKFIDELCDRLKQSKDDANTRLVIGRKVNLSYKEIANASDWIDLHITDELRTVPNYVTGQATVTQNSRTVNFSGSTVLTTDMQGRYFKLQGWDNWYKIIKVNTDTQLTLRNPVIEGSETKGFIIWKRFHYLNSDVRKIKFFGTWFRDGELESKSERYIHDHSSNISDTAVPDSYSLYGVDPYFSMYFDGTATVIQDSNVMTGTGTAWLDNVTPGDIVEIGGQVLRVGRVESDTSIILANLATSTLEGQQSYVIKRENPKGVQFFKAVDTAYILPYSYQRRVFDMVNEKDRPLLSEDFDLAILDLAEASRMTDLKDSDAQVKLAIATARIRDLKMTQIGDEPRYRQMVPYIRTRKGY